MNCLIHHNLQNRSVKRVSKADFLNVKMPGIFMMYRAFFISVSIRFVTAELFYANFLASSKNCAKPLSVKGCFNKPKIEGSGQVQTSAPASAHLII
jgi:hypothetical protein